MYYAGEPYGRVLEQFKALLKEPEFFVRLTGAQGSGKSALLEQAMQYYQAQGYLTRYFPANPDSPMALRSALRKSFDLPKTHNFQRNLQEFLSSEAARHKGIVLVFDDCHLMNNATLLELTKLTDIQISNSCMLSIIMCGSDVLDERLNRDHELRPVLQRITMSAQLTALDKKGTALFLLKLFDSTGQQDLVFEPQALTLLFDVSRGLPQRLVEIGSLCSNLYRSQELGSPVRKSDLSQVLKHPSLAMRGFNRNRPNRRLAMAAVAATSVVAVTAIAWINLLPSQVDLAPYSPATVTASSVAVEAPVVEVPVVEVPVVEVPVVEALAAQPTAVGLLPPVIPPADNAGVADNADIIPQISLDNLAALQDDHEITDTSPAPTAEQTLQDWIAAWQARDVDAYFSFYHADFFPRGFDSLSTWQENRRRNIANREWIEMQVSDLSIYNISERTTELAFWLDYQSPGYSDRTQKQVVMRLGDRGWQIIQEINREIIYLSVGLQQPQIDRP